ncbi:MAG: SDR family oxidoreductase [Chitinophagaceae bacterium]
MQDYYQQKVVLITGASSGIGKALAIQLLDYGAYVFVCARNQDNLNSLIEQHPHANLYTFKADVSQEQECKAFVQFAIDSKGAIDILINNAGISMRALFVDLDLSVLHQSMNINFWGAVYCTKYALPSIIKNKGSVIGISSIAGYKGLPCRTGYSASKFALQGFLESLRIEMLPSKVNVMWVSPGFVASNIRQVALGATGHSQGETPLNEDKLMSAETCADLIIKAIKKRKRTLIMTSQGVLTVWLNKFFPSFMDKKVLQHFQQEPNSPLKK